MRTSQKLWFVILLFVCNLSCKEFDSNLPTNNYRISKITQTNLLDNTVYYYQFTYQNDQLLECKTSFLNNNNQIQESRKLNFFYSVGEVEVSIQKKKNNEWEKFQKLQFEIDNDLIVRKLISRYSFPKCENCWRYEYKYDCNNLSEVSILHQVELSF